MGKRSEETAKIAEKPQQDRKYSVAVETRGYFDLFAEHSRLNHDQVQDKGLMLIEVAVVLKDGEPVRMAVSGLPRLQPLQCGQDGGSLNALLSASGKS
jgi:hypothetical protein